MVMYMRLTQVHQLYHQAASLAYVTSFWRCARFWSGFDVYLCLRFARTIFVSLSVSIDMIFSWCIDHTAVVVQFDMWPWSLVVAVLVNVPFMFLNYQGELRIIIPWSLHMTYVYHLQYRVFPTSVWLIFHDVPNLVKMSWLEPYLVEFDISLKLV